MIRKWITWEWDEESREYHVHCLDYESGQSQVASGAHWGQTIAGLHINADERVGFARNSMLVNHYWGQALPEALPFCVGPEKRFSSKPLTGPILLSLQPNEIYLVAVPWDRDSVFSLDVPNLIALLWDLECDYVWENVLEKTPYVSSAEWNSWALWHNERFVSILNEGEEETLKKFLSVEAGRLRSKLMELRKLLNAKLAPGMNDHLNLDTVAQQPPQYRLNLEGIDVSQVDLVSCDVFDTSLYRNHFSPQDIFYWEENVLIKRYGKHWKGFAWKREETENLLRHHLQRTGEAEDASLEPICARLIEFFGEQDLSARELESLEINLETSSWKPVEMVLNRLREFRDEGKRIVYVSEMYLPEKVITSWLKEHGFPEGNVYTSGDRKVSKGSGNLYREMLRNEGGSVERVMHLGDNPVSDIQVPRELGMSSAPVVCKRERLDFLSGVFSAITANDVPENVSDHIGYTVVGPVCAAFVNWIVRESQHCGIDKLYFLTRDGHLPYSCFTKIRDKIQSAPEGRMVYASRRMYNLAAMENIEAAEWDFLLKPSPGIRVRDFFERVDIPESVYGPACRKFGFEDLDQRLSHHWGFWEPANHDRLYQVFCDIIDDFNERRFALRERVQNYLADLPQGENTAMVDLGWHGSSFLAMRKLLPESQGDRLGAFYFATWGNANSLADQDGFASYFCHNGEPAYHQRILKGSVALMEFLFSSPEPTVHDVARNEDSGEWEPRYGRPLLDYNLDVLRGIERGANRFFDAWAEQSATFPMKGNGQAMVTECLERTIFNPEPKIKETLAACYHNEGWGVDHWFRMLPRGYPFDDDTVNAWAMAYAPWKAGLRSIVPEGLRNDS